MRMQSFTNAQLTVSTTIRGTAPITAAGQMQRPKIITNPIPERELTNERYSA
jgi:hypothetical protein